MSNYEIYSAGILPYTTYKDTIYFLLGRDSDNKWSDFGGRVEPKDRSDYETTASREFFEETLGSVYDYDYTRKLIKKCPKIVSKTGSGHYYYMYLLRIHYTDLIRTKFLSTKNFINNVVTSIDKKYIEKNDIRWVSIETIEHSIEGKSLINLRNVFQNTYKNHKNEIDLYIK
jgi:8-oxo-dGTP pyrophosphatase MutT (NUDIX family)